MPKEKPSLTSPSESAKDLHKRTAPSKPLQIAVDGPAGAGKSTVAKRVADALGYLYVDTGAMYRAVTWLGRKRKIPLSDRAAITKLAAEIKLKMLPALKVGENVRVFVDDEEISKEIRTQEITKLVSAISAYPTVREHLVEQQRQLAKQGGVVLDGRDIGTVVLPNADLKIFLTASPDVRAKRRLLELQAAGETADYEALLKEIVDRDQKDSNRDVAPLRMADDAILILTDNMSVPEVVSHIVQLCTDD